MLRNERDIPIYVSRMVGGEGGQIRYDIPPPPEYWVLRCAPEVGERMAHGMAQMVSTKRRDYGNALVTAGDRLARENAEVSFFRNADADNAVYGDTAAYLDTDSDTLQGPD